MAKRSSPSGEKMVVRPIGMRVHKLAIHYFPLNQGWTNYRIVVPTKESYSSIAAMHRYTSNLTMFVEGEQDERAVEVDASLWRTVFESREQSLDPRVPAPVKSMYHWTSEVKQ